MSENRKTKNRLIFTRFLKICYTEFKVTHV